MPSPAPRRSVTLHGQAGCGKSSLTPRQLILKAALLLTRVEGQFGAKPFSRLSSKPLDSGDNWRAFFLRGPGVLIDRTSLSQTVDAINAAHFDGRTLTAAERGQVARWIAARQGLPGAYGGTFAGFPSERSRGIVLFTGERIASASARHILGEEASRALRQLRVRDPNVTRALEGADSGLMRCLERAAEDPRNSNPGLYCCGKCSVGLWRNLLAGGLDRRDERLRRGASHLRSMRDGEHQWRRFPFWYTVLALSEMDSAEARTELRYAAPALERVASRAVPSAVYGRRRHALAVRTLKGL